jgi:hypothetical protein
MTPGDFLRAVWPADGIFCLATPFTIPGSNPPKRVYAHRTFDNISDAVSFVLRERGAHDLFFAIHTLKEKQVWNPEKINPKTGAMGANQVRVQPNMHSARAFFFDLDVGRDSNKYDDQKQAAADLIRFCKVTGLPRPLVTSSGGGLHVYWLVTEPLESEKWRIEAAKLKQLARHHGLKADPMRTTDTASVLRVAGTQNFKDRSAPREVKAMTPAVTTGTGAFIAMIDKAMIEAGVEAKPPPRFDAAAALLGSNTEREYEGPPVSLKALLLSCAQMKRLALAKGMYSEPEWYHGIIGVGRFLEDGHRRIQQMSQGFPGYDVDATKEKIAQHEARRDAVTGKALGPTSCAKLAEISGVGDDPCSSCPFAGKVHGPIGAARYNDPAPAPVVQELLGSGVAPVVTLIPDPPKPFVRLKGGGIAVHAENADGDVTYTTIYDHDLYPIRRLSNPQQGLEQQVWHVTLPRGESKDFTLDADMLYDTRKFVTAVANQGIYPNKGHIPTLQEYMVAYIALLQKTVDAEAQCNHLGWLDECSGFILPDKVLFPDGTAKAAQLSLGAQRATQHVHKRGDMAEQIKLLDFYNHPDYRANQFYILAGLAAPIFYATGHHGVIINASGDAGASKSTSLYTAASFWGQPELYPINGTNNGATIRGRNERVTVLANLPVCVDEITHMAVKDAIDLAMSVTQPGHRIRLQTDGVERASIGSHKATIMMTTANNSLHGLLSTDNAAGTAGSMRVFEVGFTAGKVHKKHEADAFIHAIKQNYGHLGELFVAHIMPQLDKVEARVREVTKQVDIELGIQSSERFWSATIGSILVAGEIAVAMGLVKYDIAALKRWAIDEQVPKMRGVVKEEYSDPLGIVSDYLETISSNILVLEKSTGTVGAQSYVARKPTGALLGHYDVAEQVLHVLKKGFKDYCVRIGANSLKVLSELHTLRDGARIIANTHTKRTLGAGTEYAKAQSGCFTINMAHPDITGALDLKVIAGGSLGGGQGSAPAPTLHAVQ